MTGPLLPPRWRSSYVSYWHPMLPGARITSGHVWFDYERGACRIDGMFNPWDEAAAGHLLWISEIHWFARGVMHRRQVTYTREGDGFVARALPPVESPSPGPPLPRDAVAAPDARPGDALELLGRLARPWTHALHGRALTLSLCTRTGLPLRMCTEKQPGHRSIRDFPTVTDDPIDPAIFDPAAPDPRPDR